MDPFLPITDCCGLYKTDIQEKVASYYEAASNIIFGYTDKAFATAIYGRNAEMWYNRINDIHYLVILLYIINSRRELYYTLNGEDQGLEWIYTTYRLDCIKRTFICKGIDILPLLVVWNLAPYPTGVAAITGTGSCPPMPDGIDNMHIESGPTCENLFIVQ